MSRESLGGRERLRRGSSRVGELWSHRAAFYREAETRARTTGLQKERGQETGNRGQGTGDSEGVLAEVWAGWRRRQFVRSRRRWRRLRGTQRRRRNLGRPFAGPRQLLQRPRAGARGFGWINELESLLGRTFTDWIAIVVRRGRRRLWIRNETVQRTDRAVALFIESHAMCLQNRAGLLLQVGQNR